LDNREKVRVLIAREEGLPLPPPAQKPDGLEGDSGIGVGKRAIPQGHQFDPNALKPLARTLFAASVALGHSLTAYREFARIKSASISPDGMLGGKGYVLKVKEVRSQLQQACELLSSITDTLHDEVHAPHWQPDVTILDETEANEIEGLIEESDDVLQDPEQYGGKEVDEAEKAPKTKKLTDRIKDEENKESGASRVPGGGAQETSEPTPAGDVFKVKQARDWKAPFIQRVANSSLPVNTLPGPRVDHLERGEQTGSEGSYNKDEPTVNDEWGKSEGVGDEYIYTTPWENDTSRSAGAVIIWGKSNLPSDDDTHGEANDFGLGYGAKGQGSEGYGTTSPDGRGVYGPQSGLPNDPGGLTHDPEGGATPFDDKLSPNNVWAAIAESELPFDGPDPVARSDYFEGDKGNQFNVQHHGTSGLPEMNIHSPEAPLTPRPSHNLEHMFAESQMPGDGGVNYDHYRDTTPNVGENTEQQDVPYIKWKSDAHDYRNDQQDLYREDYH